MADFEPNTIPAINPKSVRRTDENGFPTTALLDYEQALQSWMRANVVNINFRINEVRDVADGAAAAVIEEANTRATADEALAEDITTVQASVGNATAQGQINFAAKATPAGSIAAYGLHLTAGGAFAGFEALAFSGGGSAIGLTANKFFFTDSGTAQQVLTYSGGVFTFNVPIAIRSGPSGERIVITNQSIRVYDASNVERVAIGIGI